MKNVFRQIKHHEKNLSKLELIVVDYFMAGNPELPLRELADEIHLSPATISRFVRKVGYDNYQQFLDAYTYALEEQAQEVSVDIRGQHLETVNNTHELIESIDIDRIINKFIGKRVLIVAKDDTAVACLDFVNRLKRLEIDASIATTRQEMILNSSFLKPDDVVIAVSISGHNDTLNKFIDEIKTRGVYTLGISSEITPLIEKCDDNIQVYQDTGSIMSFNFSYALPLIILFDYIYMHLQLELDERFVENKNMITQKIVS